MLLDSALGSWLPDAPDLNNPGVVTAYNVVAAPGTQQGAVTYQPLLAAKPYYATASMTSRPLGTSVGKDKLGNAKVYGGSKGKLYKINPATSNWQDISRAAGYATADGERWESTQYGSGVYFTNYSDEIQFIDRNIDIQFANLTTLVKARHIATIKDFVVIGNTYDALDGAVPFRIRWSGLGLPDSWTFSQSTGADFQDVYGLGACQGIVGGEIGWLLMEQGIVKMTYTEYPYWFRFDPVAKSKGCAVSQSVITVEGMTYFIANDGFYVMDGVSGQTASIGNGKIHQFFLNSVDTSQYQWMTVAADPRAKLIYWSYMSTAALDGVPDRMLIYNYMTGDWTIADATADFVFNSLSLPWTIEQLDVFGTIENVPASFDSPLWAGGNAMLWAMKQDGSIWVFGGDPLPATIETGEQDVINVLRQMNPQTQGDRATIKAVRPLFDGVDGSAVVSIGYRDRPNGELAWTQPKTVHDQTGFAYFRDTARYMRFRVQLSNGWASATKLQTDAHSAGWR